MEGLLRRFEKVSPVEKGCPIKKRADMRALRGKEKQEERVEGACSKDTERT